MLEQVTVAQVFAVYFLILRLCLADLDATNDNGEYLMLVN
jgi:hypothetical protein